MIRSLLALPLNRLVPLGIVAVSGGALAVALFVEFGLGVQACPLCRYQQIIHGANAAIGLMALAAPVGARARAALIGLSGIVFLAGLTVAFYQVGLQQHWWADAVETCAGAIPDSLDPNNLMAALAAPEKACDEVDWTILGLSAAAHNAILSLVAAVATLGGLAALLRRRDS